MGLADIGALVVVGLFGLWGWFRGPVRQLLSLVFLAAALFLAGRVSGNLEGLVGKVASLSDHERCLVAWIVVVVGTVLVGSALIAILGVLRIPGSPRLSRWIAAGLGGAKGLLVLVLALYALLGAHDARTRPAFVDSIERSVAARCLRWTADRVRSLVPLPPCVVAEVEAVNRRVPLP
jgi:uncharacterized membrane protein required for colicin V production